MRFEIMLAKEDFQKMIMAGKYGSGQICTEVSLIVNYV